MWCRRQLVGRADPDGMVRAAHVGAIQVAPLDRACLNSSNDRGKPHGDGDPCRMQLVLEQVVGPHHALHVAAGGSERLAGEQEVTLADRVHLVHHGQRGIAHVGLVLLRDLVQIVAQPRVIDVLARAIAVEVSADESPRVIDAEVVVPPLEHRLLDGGESIHRILDVVQHRHSRCPSTRCRGL